MATQPACRRQTECLLIPRRKFACYDPILESLTTDDSYLASESGADYRDSHATKIDWERHKATIEHLYLGKKKNLKELIEIMARDHNFFAT